MGKFSNLFSVAQSSVPTTNIGALEDVRERASKPSCVGSDPSAGASGKRQLR